MNQPSGPPPPPKSGQGTTKTTTTADASSRGNGGGHRGGGRGGSSRRGGGGRDADPGGGGRRGGGGGPPGASRGGRGGGRGGGGESAPSSSSSHGGGRGSGGRGGRGRSGGTRGTTGADRGGMPPPPQLQHLQGSINPPPTAATALNASAAAAPSAAVAPTSGETSTGSRRTYAATTTAVPAGGRGTGGRGRGGAAGVGSSSSNSSGGHRTGPSPRGGPTPTHPDLPPSSLGVDAAAPPPSHHPHPPKGGGHRGGRGAPSKAGKGAAKTVPKSGSGGDVVSDENDAVLRAQIEVDAEAVLQRRRDAEAAHAAAEARQEAEAKAAAAQAALAKEMEALATQARDAVDIVQTAVETSDKHRACRDALVPERLAMARRDFESNKKSLKTDLKKCTAFVKKVKSGAAWMQKNDDLLKDVSILNLSRYVEEVASAVLESKPKVSDLPAVVALCVAMHERYDEFLPNVLPPLWEALAPSKGGGSGGGPSASNDPDLAGGGIKSKRWCFRLLTEFVLAGLVTDVKGLLRCVADAAGHHKEGNSNTTAAAATGAVNDAYTVHDATLLVAFGKAAGFELLGVLPRPVRIAADTLRQEQRRLQEATESDASADPAIESEGMADAPAPPSSVLAPADTVAEGCQLADRLDAAVREHRAVKADVSDLFAQHCRGAYHFLVASLLQTHARLQKLERRCEQDRLLSGTLPEAREKGLTDARKLKDTLLKSVEALADALDEDVPVLIDDSAAGGPDAGKGVEVWTKGAGEDDNLGPFDDEETRAFYCDVPDLLATVPPVLLGLSPDQVEKKKEENAKKFGKDIDIGTEGIEDSPEVAPASEAELEATMNDLKLDDKGADDGLGGEGDDKNTPRYRLVVLLEEELPECNRREQVDELSEKFSTNYGSNKNARKRLSKTLFLVPRNRFDLLPFYSRLAATVDRVWSDVTAPLVTDLEQQFHGQAKFKKNQNLDARFKTARYIGELTKFRVAPPIVFLRCLRRCLDDFTGGNVDVACCLLESCGRFLYRLPHTSTRVSDLMEAMARFSKAKNLDERSQSLIKSAFYSVKPPAGVRRRIKEYPPLETYLRGLLIERMVPTPTYIAFAAKQLARLPWSVPSHQCGALVTRLMLKACRRGRYRTIQAVALVAARLRTHKVAGEITVRLVDAVLEELRWALENPNFRDQQRVLTYARLLGELYEASQVSGQLVIRQLFDFVDVGHEIPDALREASKRLATDEAAPSATDGTTTQLPVYNSAKGVSQTIMEDEEMEETDLETMEEEHVVEPPKPVAVSEHSKFDPRVPSPTDPPNSAYRIKLVCTLLEVAAPSIVTRNNVPHLKGFLASFQRYLFTKAVLPADVEFALLDTFDMLDSHWKTVTKSKKHSDGEDGFPRYTTWLDAHNTTVVYEDEVARVRAHKAEASASDPSDAKSVTYSLDGQSGRDEEDDDTMTNYDEEEEEEDDDDSLQSNSDSERLSDDPADDGEATVDDDGTSADEGEEDDDVEASDDSEQASDEEDEEMEEEFDEEAYMRQLEEEDFERELRRMTMDAIERGKNASRKVVADTMPSGSQIAKKKGPDPTPAESVVPAPSPFALGGKEGVAFQVLKKGSKGKVEARELVVPKDTNLAVVVSKNDDEAARERDEIKRRVLRYEAESAYAEESGGNVYLEQEKLQVIRNRPLSLETIDRNFGTSGGNLKTKSDKASAVSPPSNAAGAAAAVRRPAPGPGRGRSGLGRGRGRGSSGRTLFR